MRLPLALAFAGLLTLPGEVRAQAPDSAGPAVSAAEAAAQAWLRLVDARRYDESWDSAAAVFRSAVTKPARPGTVRAARGALPPRRHLQHPAPERAPG
jgi:cation transport regulator ChaB